MMAWEILVSEYLMLALSMCGVLFVMNLLFTLPAVYLTFRIDRWSRHWLSLTALALGVSLGCGVLYRTFSLASVSFVGAWYAIMLIGCSTIPPILILFIGLEVMRSCGVRMARYEQQPLLCDESVERERHAGRKLHRKWAAGLVSIAILASFATMQLDDWRKQVDQRNLDTFRALQPQGGSIKIREGVIYSLALGPETTDWDISAYVHLSDVVELSLAGTQITNAGLAQLQEFHKLRRLDLSNTKISDAGLEQLKKLTRLEHLSIAGTKISPSRLPDLMQALSLSSLDVGHLGLDDQFGWLLRGGSRSLKSISIRGNPISDAGLKAFLAHPSEVFANPRLNRTEYFEKLDLSGTKIDGSVLAPQLVVGELILDDLPLTDANFGAALPGLSVNGMLRLRRTALTDSILPLIAKSAMIRGLELGDGNFTEVGLAGLGTRTFTRLALTGKQFTGHCFQFWRPAIYDLDMSSSGITDDTIAYVANLRLYRLNLANTQLTDAALPKLAKSAGAFLDLSLTKITAQGLLANPLSNYREIRVAVGQFCSDEIRKLKQSTRIVIGESNIVW